MEIEQAISISKRNKQIKKNISKVRSIVEEAYRDTGFKVCGLNVHLDEKTGHYKVSIQEIHNQKSLPHEKMEQAWRLMKCFLRSKLKKVLMHTKANGECEVNIRVVGIEIILKDYLFSDNEADEAKIKQFLAGKAGK